MIQLQKSIQQRIQEELDKNTQGLDFEVSLYTVKSNDKLEKEVPVGNTYATEQKRFIPFVIEDISGDYADVKGLTAIEANINSSILIPVDSQDYNNIIIEENFENLSKALDKFIQDSLVKKYPLGDTEYIISDEYDFEIDLSESLSIAKKYKFVTKFLDFSEGVIFTYKSNEVTYTFEKTTDKIILFTDDGTKTESFSVDYDLESKYSFNFQKVVSSLNISLEKDDVELESETFTDSSGEVSLKYGGFFGKAYEFSVLNDSDQVLSTISDFIMFENSASAYESIFKNKNIDNVVETGSLGHISFGFSIPNPTTNQFTFGNGLNYQQYELSMTCFISDNSYVGQEVKYYLDDIEIFPYYRDEGYTGDLDPAQIITQQATRFVTSQSVLSKEFTVYYTQSKQLKDILKKISSEEMNPNEVFKLKIQYPLFSKEYDVIISQAGLNITNNMPISISIKLDLADSILNQ